jgi:prevent-host-death family protein
MIEYSIAEANSNFARIVREAEAGQAVTLVRRGKPVAVVISTTQYEKLLLRNQNKPLSIQQLRKKYQLDQNGLTDDEFALIMDRDRSPGRDFKFED